MSISKINVNQRRVLVSLAFLTCVASLAGCTRTASEQEAYTAHVVSLRADKLSILNTCHYDAQKHVAVFRMLDDDKTKLDKAAQAVTKDRSFCDVLVATAMPNAPAAGTQVKAETTATLASPTHF